MALKMYAKTRKACMLIVHVLCLGRRSHSKITEKAQLYVTAKIRTQCKELAYCASVMGKN